MRLLHEASALAAAIPGATGFDEVRPLPCTDHSRLNRPGFLCQRLLDVWFGPGVTMRNRMAASFLSVIVPFYNEEGNVRPLTEKVFEVARQLPGTCELILVDDCSTDSTWARIQEVSAQDNRVRPQRHKVNSGQSASLWTGFGAARGDIIATLDGDLQNDPADLPQMLRLLEHCDMVTGVRTRRADNFNKRVSTKVARWARRLVFQVDFADTGCNLRVFKRAVLETIPPFNGFHRFIPILTRAAGAIVKEMPVTHHRRHSGTSKYGLRNRVWRGILDLIMVRLYARRQLQIYGRKNVLQETAGTRSE